MPSPYTRLTETAARSPLTHVALRHNLRLRRHSRSGPVTRWAGGSRSALPAAAGAAWLGLGPSLGLSVLLLEAVLTVTAATADRGG